jgi:hypothetical protein
MHVRCHACWNLPECNRGRIEEHPIRFGSGTFTKPMPTPDGKSIAPTGKRFAIGMVTVGHWKGATMDHEWLFWDNQDFMNQIGLGKTEGAR